MLYCQSCHSNGTGPAISNCVTCGLQIGAAAFMAGATRMTLTTTVMVMETTGAMQLIVPLMITVFVAKVRLPHVPLLNTFTPCLYISMQIEAFRAGPCTAFSAALAVLKQGLVRLIRQREPHVRLCRRHRMRSLGRDVESHFQCAKNSSHHSFLACRWWGTSLEWAWMTRT